jgi:hypothetical protein
MLAPVGQGYLVDLQAAGYATTATGTPGERKRWGIAIWGRLNADAG